MLGRTRNVKYRQEKVNIMNYCINCGSPLTIKEFEKRQRAFCPKCGHIHFEQLKVGAGGIIEQDCNILLLKRSTEPFANSWNLPAGYVEIDENPIHAVIREVYEETGLKVETTKFENIYFFNYDPRGNGILIVYRCKIIGGQLSESNEATSPIFFNKSDTPNNLAGGGHNQAIMDWKASTP
jgi:ADP-ribose pyrophosphatase YjhB (NUDIX family)